MKTNIKTMKISVFYSIVLSVFFALMSFSWSNSNAENTYNSRIIASKTMDSTNDVIITYEKPDVCSLNYLGDIKVTEKFLFFNNNGLKRKTLIELKKQASEKNGTIVYVYTGLQNGFGIGFTRTINACVFNIP